MLSCSDCGVAVAINLGQPLLGTVLHSYAQKMVEAIDYAWNCSAFELQNWTATGKVGAKPP